MLPKRKRHDADDASRSTTAKRTRHTSSPDLLSPLSDELLVRILSYLPLHDLLNVAPVSDRFYHISGDSQIWKRLYYSRFVLPRALRIPGFRDGSAREGKLHYSSRKAIWADGRRGGWVDMRSGIEDKDARNWKRQYKLRHNWSRGKCAVEELRVGRESDLPSNMESPESPHRMLVKVSDGLAITADLTTGLRAWDLKTKQLLAQVSLDQAGPAASPSCITIDDQNPKETNLHIAIGFTDGSFGVWRLDITGKKLIQRYRHEGSSNGELLEIAFSYPYLLTATKSVLISLYTFERRPVSKSTLLNIPSEDESESDPEFDEERYRNQKDNGDYLAESKIKSDSKRQAHNTTLPAPYLLTSLKSHTSRAPLALSLRKLAINTVASIAYTFSTMQGWSLGIQDLHIRPTTSNSKSTPEITTTRLAYTLPIKTPRTRGTLPSSHTASFAASLANDLEGPTNICYTHPYLLATLPDNTLILYLCKSNASSLSISPGIRLWGHTSGISDAEITARGKAVSVSCRGEEIRVWELEGRADGRSIEVRPTVKSAFAANAEERGSEAATPMRWDERRNWVGFDDEMVIVLKESGEGNGSLLVYDFT